MKYFGDVVQGKFPYSRIAKYLLKVLCKSTHQLWDDNWSSIYNFYKPYKRLLDIPTSMVSSNNQPSMRMN